MKDNTKCLDCSGDYYQPNENGECVIDLFEIYFKYWVILYLYKALKIENILYLKFII